MARAGDKDEAGPGASVAPLSDAARRRTEGVPRRTRRKRADPPPQPDPNAGTGLISNLDAREPDELVDETADDKLDQVLARQQSPPDRKPRVLSVPEAPERDPQPSLIKGRTHINSSETPSITTTSDITHASWRR